MIGTMTLVDTCVSVILCVHIQRDPVFNDFMFVSIEVEKIYCLIKSFTNGYTKGVHVYFLIQRVFVIYGRHCEGLDLSNITIDQH